MIVFYVIVKFNKKNLIFYNFQIQIFVRELRPHFWSIKKSGMQREKRVGQNAKIGLKPAQKNTFEIH